MTKPHCRKPAFWLPAIIVRKLHLFALKFTFMVANVLVNLPRWLQAGLLSAVKSLSPSGKIAQMNISNGQHFI